MAIILFLILLAFSTATEADTQYPPALTPSQHENQLAKFVAQIIEHYDYQSTKMDQTMSERIFDHYLTTLDPQKIYLTMSDIETFSSDKESLAQAIYQQDLQFPFEIFNAYQRRVIERFKFSRNLLKTNFNFDSNESYDEDRAKGPREKSKKDLHILWRKLVMNDWLELKLNGEDDQRIRGILDKRYSDFLAGEYKLQSEDVFQTFMDAYTTSVEPHTNYLGLKAAAEFDIEMKQSIVGIGAMFQHRGDYLAIRELAPEGPAALSTQLHIGDRLVAVGQGSDGPIVNVVGWRSDDVANLVRGPKGSTVRLVILPGSVGQKSKVKNVTLVRNTVSFTEDAAQKNVIQIQDGALTRNIAVISLPVFYQDFGARTNGDKDYKSVTRDVARLLEELKDEKVDSVLVDLRDNGGGSLDEAVMLAGLFIGKGPVVQERDGHGNVNISNAGNATPLWSGPLGVLINRDSASASEIFAAAIQDYGRGIIIGETSFGKGTVQTILNLDRIMNNDKPEFGELKITVAQFFRINGTSTQLRGVTPDISLPPLSDSGNFSESTFGNALPWAKIKPANYVQNRELTNLIPLLQHSHLSRIEKDVGFQFLEQENERFNLLMVKHSISLNEAKRRKERDAEEAESRYSTHAIGIGQSQYSEPIAIEELSEKKNENKVGNEVVADKNKLASESSTNPVKKIAKDLWLNEAAHILVDAVDLQQSNLHSTTVVE